MIHQKILEILHAIRPEVDFTVSDDFIGDGLLDSFDMVSLVTELDRAFSVSIPGTHILPEHFQNTAAIAALLASLGVEA